MKLISKENMRWIWFFAVFLLLLKVIQPFWIPLAMGGLLAAALSPLAEKLEAKKISRFNSSLLVTLGAVVLVFLPTAFFSVIAVQFVGNAISWFKMTDGKEGMAQGFSLVEHWAQAKLSMLPDSVPREEILQSLVSALKSAATFVGEFLGQVLQNLPGIGMQTLMTLLALFFFLLDGKKIVFSIRRNPAFSPEDTESLINAVQSSASAVFWASLAVGLVQSMILLVFGAFAGVHGLGILAAVVFLGSFIPVVGAAPVTVSWAVWLWVSQGAGSGLALLVGVALAAGADNIVRPWFLRGSAGLHPLLAMCSAIGGLSAFGFAGIFLGPVIAVGAVATYKLLSDQNSFG